MPLFRPSELLSFLSQEGLTPKKHLSQNFLIDGNVLRNILNTAEIEKGDLVLEIGSGPGVFTEALLEKGAHVIAVEKDPSFASLLQRLQTEDKRLVVFQEDILSFPLEFIKEASQKAKKKVKIVANLPYHIATPALASFVSMHEVISSITVIIQKEVALRFTAQKNTLHYSALSLFIQYHSHPSYCFTIEPSCFFPKPSVQSAVIRLDIKPPPEISSKEAFFSLVHQAFQKRRKMLRASLKPLYGTTLIEETLKNLNLSPHARPEELSLGELRSFFELLYEKDKTKKT